VTRPIFSVPLYVLTCLGRYRTDLPSSAGRPFSAAHFLGRFGLIPAPAASRLLLSRFRPYPIGFPPIKQPLALEAAALASGCPKKMGQEKGENSAMSYLNSITLVGFVGSDPEQRQAKGNGSKFTVVARQNLS
jgi:hypothetical protein